MESFKSRMILTEEQIMQGYTIEYVDFCSLYPYVQWYFQFTKNAHPTVIVEKHQLNGLVQDAEALKQFLDFNYGLCYCRIVPPRRLTFAVLPCRINEKTVFTLCRTCAEEYINEVRKESIITIMVYIFYVSGLPPPRYRTCIGRSVHIL